MFLGLKKPCPGMSHKILCTEKKVYLVEQEESMHDPIKFELRFCSTTAYGPHIRTWRGHFLKNVGIPVLANFKALPLVQFLSNNQILKAKCLSYCCRSDNQCVASQFLLL